MMKIKINHMLLLLLATISFAYTWHPAADCCNERKNCAGREATRRQIEQYVAEEYNNLASVVSVYVFNCCNDDNKIEFSVVTLDNKKGYNEKIPCAALNGVLSVSEKRQLSAKVNPETIKNIVRQILPMILSASEQRKEDESVPDSHGCYATAGYQWCEATQRCYRRWEERCPRYASHTCTCSTPGRGTSGHNRFTCTNGQTRHCAANQECYNKKAFPYGQWTKGCRVPKIQGLSEQLSGRVGGDTDSHGCHAGAGYQWCEATHRCYRRWEEQCPRDATAYSSFGSELLGSDLLKSAEHRCISADAPKPIETTQYSVGGDVKYEKCYTECSKFNKNGYRCAAFYFNHHYFESNTCILYTAKDGSPKYNEESAAKGTGSGRCYFMPSKKSYLSSERRFSASMPKQLQESGSSETGFSVAASGYGDFTGCSYTVPAHSNAHVTATLQVLALTSKDVQELNEMVKSLIGASKWEKATEHSSTQAHGSVSFWSLFGSGAGASYSKTSDVMHGYGISKEDQSKIVGALMDAAGKMSNVMLDVEVFNKDYDYSVSGNAFIWVIEGSVKTDQGQKQFRMLNNKGVGGNGGNVDPSVTTENKVIGQFSMYASNMKESACENQGCASKIFRTFPSASIIRTFASTAGQKQGFEKQFSAPWDHRRRSN